MGKEVSEGDGVGVDQNSDFHTLSFLRGFVVQSEHNSMIVSKWMNLCTIPLSNYFHSWTIHTLLWFWRFMAQILGQDLSIISGCILIVGVVMPLTFAKEVSTRLAISIQEIK